MQKIFKTLCLAIFALTLFSCGGAKGGYTLTGDVKSAEGTIYLSVLEGKMPKLIDSAVVADGKFSFKGNLPMAGYAQLQVKGDRSPFLMFFIENSDISINGDKSDPRNISVVGSATNDHYTKGYMPISNDVEAIKKFVRDNNTSVAAAYVLFRNLIYQLEVEELEELKGALSPELHQTSYIKIFDERIAAMKGSAVGQKFTEIALPDTAGNILTLSSVVAQGKYVLLDFWASWCPPCRAENPHVVEAFKQYADKGFTVYGVSLDKPDDKALWIKAIEDDGLHWNNVSDLKFWECGPAAQYGVSSIPSNFLISPEGVIVGRNLRGDALTAKLEELLGDKK
ncbi:MAG: TlpA disulfide reductase family protein [Rikenellaceae bacterium]